MRVPLAFIPAMLLLSACATGGGGGAAAEIRGTEWTAVDIAGRGVIGERPPTLRLQRGRNLAGGESGCNIWHANYRLGRGTVSFDGVGSTRRFCPEPLLGQENLFLGLIGEADRYTVWADGSMTLAAPSGRTITFRRLPAAP